MIISKIQWNGSSIPFAPELLLHGMIFQKNVDIFFEWKRIIWNEMKYSFLFFIATGKHFVE